MDAAEYQRIADHYQVCQIERDYELACARWDVVNRPDRAHGRDPYAMAADALTAARAHPRRHLPEHHFAHYAWQPGDIVPDHWGRTPADEWMEWFQQATGRA
jgi:hypothetical protein